MTSSKFREKFLTALEHVAKSVDRFCVGCLPREVEGWVQANRRALEFCKDGLTEEEVEAILRFFNGKFGSGFTHFCVPGCCQGNDDFYETPGWNSVSFSFLLSKLQVSCEKL